MVLPQGTHYYNPHTYVTDEVLRPLACINKVLGVVIMRVGALSAFEKDVGVLVGTAILTKDLSYLLVQSQRERENVVI